MFFWGLLFSEVAIEGKCKINFPTPMLKEATIKHAKNSHREVKFRRLLHFHCERQFWSKTNRFLTLSEN